VCVSISLNVYPHLQNYLNIYSKKITVWSKCFFKSLGNRYFQNKFIFAWHVYAKIRIIRLIDCKFKSANKLVEIIKQLVEGKCGTSKNKYLCSNHWLLVTIITVLSNISLNKDWITHIVICKLGNNVRIGNWFQYIIINQYNKEH